MAGLADAVPGVGWPLEAGYHLEIRFVRAGGMPLGIAGAWLGAVAKRAGAVGRNGLLDLLFWGPEIHSTMHDSLQLSRMAKAMRQGFSELAGERICRN